MKVLNLLAFALLVAALGAFSISRIQAQTPAPAAAPTPQCMHTGMSGGMGNGMMGSGMMGNGMMMPGMHGAADQAYMQSMMAMHHGMQAHGYTGNPDHDFMAMMIPHHQAAIDMARTELQYGKNPKLRAMARAIIKAQQAEIDQMTKMLQ